MPKRLHQADGSSYSANKLGGWSIGSNGLTSSGQNELLKQIGRQLQSDYQSVLNEPTPDRIKDLLKRLEAKTRDEDHLDEEQ